MLAAAAGALAGAGVAALALESLAGARTLRGAAAAAVPLAALRIVARLGARLSRAFRLHGPAATQRRSRAVGGSRHSRAGWHA